MAEGDQPKIIVDDDWKSQAQAEKQKLAEQAKAKAEEKAGVGKGEKLGFADLVRMFATQALMYLGAIPDPETGRAMVSLEIAKINIDLLAVLEEKTKNNLSKEEEEMLSGTLHELRMQFVEIAKAVEKAQQEGRIGPDGMMRPQGGGPGGPGGAGGMGNIAGPGL